VNYICINIYTFCFKEYWCLYWYKWMCCWSFYLFIIYEFLLC
jgi:hypothetical protein